VELVYRVKIDEEIYNLDGLLETLDETIYLSTDSNIIKSRLESPDEICENGDWEVSDE
jgi:hypothetical protein